MQQLGGIGDPGGACWIMGWLSLDVLLTVYLELSADNGGAAFD